MSEHEEIRKLLPLAAADALDAEQQRALEQHLRGCADCAAEWEGWGMLAEGLRRLPTPQAPPALVERIRARLETRLAEEMERRWERGVLVFLLLFAWTGSYAGWLIFRMVSGEPLGLLAVGFGKSLLWPAVYTALAWVGTAVAAGVLALRHRRERRAA